MVLSKTAKTKARIGMALAFPDYLVFEKKPKPGRLNNLLGHLRRECEKRLAYMIGRAQLSPEENKALESKMQEFGKATGWEGRARHPMTYLAFLLALFDSYPEDGIIGALNDLASFFEDGEDSPAACMPAGALAFEKWEMTWKEEK